MPAEPLLFETAFPPNPLFCHTEFLEKLSDYRTQPLGKRQRLSVDERRLHYKATHGPNPRLEAIAARRRWRQYLSVRPDLAWSRAHQGTSRAAALLPCHSGL